MRKRTYRYNEATDEMEERIESAQEEATRKELRAPEPERELPTGQYL